MHGRQAISITYARKKRRAQKASKKMLSSPLEILPPEVADLTRPQMARRMLKRSRRVSLAEQSEDKNVEHIRAHLAKRIKRTQELASTLEPVSFDMAPMDGIAFQTPFSSQSVHESAVAKLLVPEQLSPVPVAKRVMSRTSSRNLKENGAHIQTLASPFCSRPGSTASSPKHNGRGQLSRRALRRPFPGVPKENNRRGPRKASILSPKDTNKEPPVRHIKHQRYFSSSSISYMRPQITQEDWFAPPKALSRPCGDDNEIPSSPDGSVDANASFYADRPQSCSTPAPLRRRNLSSLHSHKTGSLNLLGCCSPCKDVIHAGALEVEMTDGTLPQQRQTIHLSGNSVFSSSDEFTIALLPTTNDGTAVKKGNIPGWDKAPGCVAPQTSARREAADKSPEARSLAGSFITQYNIPLNAATFSTASPAATKRGPGGVPKVSIGERFFGLPGTSPSRDFGPSTPAPSSPSRTTACPPPSPASDLALEFGSMDIYGDDTYPEGNAYSSSALVPLRVRSHSLHGGPAHGESTAKMAGMRRPARNRAGTIRASDFAQPGVSCSAAGPGLTAPPLFNVRRTRSGTVVGPNSKLEIKSPNRPTNSAGITGFASVQSESESESDDELLLKAAWIEDLEYLGLAVPRSRKEVETDEMNLGGLWHGLQSGPPRRLGLRRR